MCQQRKSRRQVNQGQRQQSQAAQLAKDNAQSSKVQINSLMSQKCSTLSVYQRIHRLKWSRQYWKVTCVDNSLGDTVSRPNKTAVESKFNTSIFKRGIMIDSSQKMTDNVWFIKFVHTSLPFCGILKDDQSKAQLNELDIAWNNEDGTKINVADSLFDDDVEHRFIPMPAQPQHSSKPVTHYDDVRSTMSPQIDNTFFCKSTRNKYMNPKPRSLLRPTQIKDYRLVKNEGDSEDDVISEMRSLTVRPITKEGHADSFSRKNHTARMTNKGLDADNDADVSAVDMKTKRRLLRWLEQISLIRRRAVSIEEFPQFCRNGVIFFDLVNKLNGRTPVLNGVQRNPK